jgi:hypothetical protein
LVISTAFRRSHGGLLHSSRDHFRFIRQDERAAPDPRVMLQCSGGSIALPGSTTYGPRGADACWSDA